MLKDEEKRVHNRYLTIAGLDNFRATLRFHALIDSVLPSNFFNLTV